MSSRDLKDLHPDIREKAEKFLHICSKMGINLLITCTYRSNSEQADLYAKGRTAPGKIVTYALPGESNHNFVDASGKPAAKAFDVVPLVAGKPVWNASDPVWKVIGGIGTSLGLKWAGEWKRFKEYPHFEI